MKRVALALIGCIAALPALAGDAIFTEVRYAGDDGAPAVSTSQYLNPVVAGFYPDPSAIRVGDDFYLVTSTFGYFPGLPIFHSRDLVSWKQIGNAIDRPTQMDYGDDELTRGLFAASISSTHSTCRVGFICLRNRESSTEKMRSFKSSCDSVQIPSRSFAFLFNCEMSTFRVLAIRSAETPRSMARLIMKCSCMVDSRLIRLLYV